MYTYFDQLFRRFASTIGVVILTVVLTMASTVVAAPIGAKLLQETSLTEELAFQGSVSDTNEQPLNGTYTIAFRLYQEESGGSAVWEEVQEVSIANGLFNVMLDVSKDVIADNIDLHLGISVASDQELSPRTKLASVPRAVSADILTTVVSSSAPQIQSVQLGQYTTSSTEYVDIPGSELSVVVDRPSTLLVSFSGSVFSLMQSNKAAGAVLTISHNGTNRDDLVSQNLFAWSSSCCTPNPAISPAGFSVPIPVEAGTHTLKLRISASSYDPSYRHAGIGYSHRRSTFSVMAFDR